MAAVDVQAIEAAMKIAALDGLRGFAQGHYGTIKQYRETEHVSKSSACGYQVLREPLWNKGSYHDGNESFHPADSTRHII